MILYTQNTIKKENFIRKILLFCLTNTVIPLYCSEKPLLYISKSRLLGDSGRSSLLLSIIRQPQAFVFHYLSYQLVLHYCKCPLQMLYLFNLINFTQIHYSHKRFNTINNTFYHIYQCSKQIHVQIEH